MSCESVKAYLEAREFDREILVMPASTATVDMAAEALGVDADHIAKTLALRQGEKCVVLVMSGRARIDNHKYKDAFATKAKMMSLEDAAAVTGHPIGGVCPFGLPADMEIYLDETLRQHDEIYPAAGDVNACLRLTVDELKQLTGGEWVDVCRQ